MLQRFIVAILSLCVFDTAAYAQALPAKFSLQSLQQGQLTPADVRGQVLLIDFWASWCKGCSKVMALADRLAKAHPGKLRFISVSVDEDIAAARKYFADLGDDFKSLRAHSYFDATTAFAEALEISALPSLLLVGSDGKVLMHITGQPDARQEQELRLLLERMK